MRHQTTAVVLACLLVLAGDAVAQPQPNKEPAFNGKTVREWLKLLESQNYLERQQAASALVKIGPPALPDLTEALKKPTLQDRVIPILGEMGPEAKLAIPAFVELLKGRTQAKDASGRSALLFALSKIGTD